MKLLGDLNLIGGGQVVNFRPEVLTDDPVAPVAGQIWYNETLGAWRAFDGTTVTSISMGGDTGPVLALLNAAIEGAGLESDGTYAADATTNYLTAATSLKDADKKLDAQLKVIADLVAEGGDTTAIQAELDATQVGAGLAANGSYTAHTDTNYINSATSLHNADKLLDTAVKSAADAAGAAATAAGNAASAAAAAQSAAEAAQTTADAALPKAGGAMVGAIAMGDNKITGLAPGTNATDAINKNQLDTALSGLDFQPDVWGVQTDATLVPELVEGRRYIVTNIAALADEFGTIADVGNNDIVEYDGTEFQVVYDVSVQGPGALAWNRADNQFWRFDNTSWAAFGGIAGVDPGIGLEKQGNVLNVLLGAGVGQLPTNEVGLDLLAAGGLFLTVDGTAASTDADAQLAVLIDGTSLARSATGLKIANAGVTAAHIAAAALGNGLEGGAGTALAVKAGTGIVVDGDGVSLNPSALSGYVKADGTTTLTGLQALFGAPTADLHGATKKYVDDADAALQSAITELQGKVSARHSFVYDGTATAALTHTVNHNLGQKFVNVSVYDDAGLMVIPDSVSLTNANSLVVGFASAVACTVVVTGQADPVA